MKTSVILTITALALAALPSCDRQSSDAARRIAELERKNQQAADRQSELEQQLQDQKLAAERDAIERERAQIEADRADLERQTGQAAADQEEALRKREAEMANREGRLEEIQASLTRKEDELGARDQDLTKRDRELAGREAINPEPSDPGEPVGDYGTFYDSLSSYGSWFDTPDYGYVWQPAVVSQVNWRPYSRGRWVCSDRGWNWISEEPFGWATYHYGRWALLRGRGWIWVPGTEWAPCWVSWRENDSHIGWAPLPPETMGWRGNGWDNTVDVSYGIGAAWYSFVEVQYFGGPLYSRCLPLSGNGGWYGSTVNITNIYIKDSLIICGGPRYDRISKRIGRPLPFYRLEVDHHPRLGRDSSGMRPQIHGGKLRVSAPNLNAGWNDGLRPKKVRSRIDKLEVERDQPLDSKITNRFRQTRIEGRQRAEEIIERQGGRERFEQNRREKILEGRVPEVVARPGNGNPRVPEVAGRTGNGNPGNPKVAGRPGIGNPPVAGKPDRVAPGRIADKDQIHILPPPPGGTRLPGGVTRGKDTQGGDATETSKTRQQPNVAPERSGGSGKVGQNPNPGRRAMPDVPPTRPEKQEDRGTPGKRAEIEIPKRQEPPRKEAQIHRNPNRQAQDDAARRQQSELAKQRQQQEIQRQDAQARESRKQQEQQQARQQQAARDAQLQRQQAQQQQEAQRMREAARQQQENQQRQRQMDEARQQQENQQRQRQQDDARQQQENNRRQQESARQQQENQQRQQQEQSRRQEESRQRQEQSRQQQSDEQENSRRRNR